MWNWFKKLIGYPVKPKKLPDFTIGEPDENGIAKVYADGVETQITMLVFKSSQIEKIRKAQEELEKNNKI